MTRLKDSRVKKMEFMTASKLGLEKFEKIKQTLLAAEKVDIGNYKQQGYIMNNDILISSIGADNRENKDSEQVYYISAPNQEIMQKLQRNEFVDFDKTKFVENSDENIEDDGVVQKNQTPNFVKYF